MSIETLWLRLQAMDNYWRELLIDGYAIAGCVALTAYLLWMLAS